MSKKPSAVTRFEFRNASANKGEIYLYGPIGDNWYGDGITAKAFVDGLKKLGNVRNIDVRIDSPGGLISEARAIYTNLVQHSATVRTYIDGIAASAASWIAMAGSEIHMSEGAWIMIHEARGGAAGTWRDLAKASDILRGLNDSIVKTYANRTGNTSDQIAQWMSDETWMDSATAIDRKFATHVMQDMKAVACIDAKFAQQSGFKHVPVDLIAGRARMQNMLNRAKKLKGV